MNDTSKGSGIPDDLIEALELLSKAGPNPLLIDADTYWDRYYALTDKYFPEETE